MESAVLQINKREAAGSNANKRLRKEGYIPGNIFGKGQPSMSLVIRKDELKKGLARYGRFALFKLEADNGRIFDALVKDIQLDPISRDYVHVDFQQVTLSEEVKATVPVRIEGKEALESRRLLMVHQLDAVPLKGMPQDIPNSIDIDVKDLKAGDNIFVSDIQFPPGIHPEISPEHLIISVTEAKVQKTEESEEEISEE